MPSFLGLMFGTTSESINYTHTPAVCVWAAGVGCLGDLESKVPGSYWSKSPWDTLPAILPAAELQQPEEESKRQSLNNL